MVINQNKLLFQSQSIISSGWWVAMHCKGPARLAPWITIYHRIVFWAICNSRLLKARMCEVHPFALAIHSPAHIRSSCERVFAEPRGSSNFINNAPLNQVQRKSNFFIIIFADFWNGLVNNTKGASNEHSENNKNLCLMIIADHGTSSQRPLPMKNENEAQHNVDVDWFILLPRLSDTASALRTKVSLGEKWK